MTQGVVSFSDMPTKRRFTELQVSRPSLLHHVY